MLSVTRSRCRRPVGKYYDHHYGQNHHRDDANERNGRSASPDYLPQLQRELVAVISKYVSINPDDIKVHMERQGDLEVLEVKIELPEAK